jgi:iron complex transport system ATP-binding protein
MNALFAEGLIVRRGSTTLLADANLTFDARQAVALIGPNGAGKSTLLRTLAGLEPPSGGRVRLGDRDLASLAAPARAREIGFLPQHFEPHWDFTVSDLVRIGAARAVELPAAAIEAAMAAYELRGLEKRRWSTLSGGERGRVLLAMVLVAEPPVLLADEPAAALDIRHRLDVIERLAGRGRDHVAIVVVHDLDLAFRHFDRVILLDRGAVVADAPPAELIGDPRLDETFGVRFERLQTSDGPMLRAMRRHQGSRCDRA